MWKSHATGLVKLGLLLQQISDNEFVVVKIKAEEVNRSRMMLPYKIKVFGVL